MKYKNEIIIGYNDMPLPKAEQFMPTIWQHYEAWDMDTDGDYYYLNNNDGFWSYLNVKSKEKKIKFRFVLRRPKPKYDIVWGYELEVFMIKNDITKKFDTACSFTIETDDEALYQEFLETVFMFLQHTKGVVLNQDEEYTAKAFENKFIKK